jgi:hypothetical protein
MDQHMPIQIDYMGTILLLIMNAIMVPLVVILLIIHAINLLNHLLWSAASQTGRMGLILDGVVGIIRHIVDKRVILFSFRIFTTFLPHFAGSLLLL